MSLLQGFHQQCQALPTNTALIEGERRLSYLALQQQAMQLSSHLQQRSPSTQRAAIALDRGIDAVIAIFAVLQSGVSYVPLDLKNPPQRLNYIVEDADVQCVIGIGPCPDWLTKPDLWLDINKLDLNSIPKLESNINPEALAAILYTSGSTGHPKGVALSHQAMSHFADWAADTFNINEQDRIASLTPFHFDLSVFDLFTSLSRGASVFFIPSRLTLSPSRLTAWLSEQHISVWYTVPSILSFIALKGALATTPLNNLKTVLFAGEVFPTAQLIKLCEQLPQVAFYNLYGPTETNVCGYWSVERNRLQKDQPIPIGLAACDAKLKINDDNGELLVQSTNNLSGYWQQGKLSPALDNQSVYHTGDKVSVNELGEYCYHGRLDRMLKCSGYRVEPAEIECLIEQSHEVQHCAVVGISDSASGQRPAAALVLKTGFSLADISKTIRQNLPAYMQPCKFLLLDSLPCLSNGKTDYLSLQQQLEQQ